MKRIALVTCAALPGLDPDEVPFVAALEARGHRPEAVVWDDPTVDWGAFDAVLLRSTWDYHHRRDEFLRWVGDVARRTSLWNPLELVRWNTHKSYLGTLAERGAPVVPTVFLGAGEAVDLHRLMRDRGWRDVVMKPTVGADSFGIERATESTPAEGQRLLEALLAEREVMVQPYLRSIEEPGERCLVFVDGRLSHAVRKRSHFLGGRHAGPEGVPVRPDPDEVEAAAQVLAAVSGPSPLYARVDLARDDDGVPCLIELELTEPTLFFLGAPGSAESLVAALEARLEGRPIS